MNKVIALSILVLFPALCNAQEQVQLLCNGTFNNYNTSDLRDIPITSIYLKVSGDRVEISGAPPGFNGAYDVMHRSEDTIHLMLTSNKSYEGNLNRFSGELKLMEGLVKIGGNHMTVKQILEANCSRTRSLF